MAKEKSKQEILEQKIRSRWNNMMMRCYDKAWKVKNPTYSDCEVCEEWHDYDNFRQWALQFSEQIEMGWDLDKDLMSGERLIYSPETCVFLPQEINMALPRHKIWDNGKVDFYSATTMFRFAKALEKGKALILPAAFSKLEKIINDYRDIYKANIGIDLLDADLKERSKSQKRGRPVTAFKVPLMVRITQEAADILKDEINNSEYIDDVIKRDYNERIGSSKNPVNKDLCDYSDEELRRELERRGYHGQLAKGLLIFGKKKI